MGKNCCITGLDRPLLLQEVEAPRTARQSAREGGKTVSPTHRPHLPFRKYPWYSFLLGAEPVVWPETKNKLEGRTRWQEGCTDLAWNRQTGGGLM